MRLYDALWVMAAADLKSSPEKREFGHALAVTPPLEQTVASPKGAAQTSSSHRRKVPRVKKPSK
jgi:hypothetical protein